MLEKLLMMKSFSELSKLKTYEERVRYLQTNSSIGCETFGFDRYANQAFYKSKEWKKVRDEVIIRDKGCDLGIEGYEICEKTIIHHINPVSMEQIINRDPIIFDSENLITTTHRTHNMIHYCNEKIELREPITRSKGDTTPWKVS